MKEAIRLLFLLSCAVMVTLLMVSPAYPEGDGYSVYVINPPINNNAILHGYPLPTVCKADTRIQVMACRGESEPASFLVDAERPLQQVMVRVGELTGPAGRLPAEAVDVRVAQMCYLHIGVDGIIMPWVLVHDPGMLKIVDKHPQWVLDIKEEFVGPPNARRPIAEYREGYSKMMQLTRELVDSPELQPADITDRQQFWLTVRIPNDARPGRYTAPITVTAGNAPQSELTLEVTVRPFDLLPPPFEYSLYYPTWLLTEDMTQDFIDKYHPLTEEQYLNELRNMVAHGCTNPTIYQGPMRTSDGTLDYVTFEKILELREKAGMPKSVPLYMQTHAGEPVPRRLTPEERKRAVTEVRELVNRVRQRGYSDAYIMAGDEYSGEQLRAERDSFEAVHEGGGKVWGACFLDFFDLVGDLLDLPIFFHPGNGIVDSQQQWQISSLEQMLNNNSLTTYTPRLLLTPEIQKIIQGVHRNGFKIFTYMDPPAGYQFPQWHRRHRGLGLWKVGLDGTMTWAYTHIATKTVTFGDPEIENNGIRSIGSHGFIVRGPKGVLDTLSWEAYREAVDDARYLTTLQNAIDNANGTQHAAAAWEAARWLDGLDVDVDLDATREEMARRIQLLLSLE